MKVIINADDFGFSKAINYGILEGMLNGVVTSTTMLVNMEGTNHAVCLIKQYKELNIGLHLNIAINKPLTNCPSLVDENGYFTKPKFLENDNKFNEEEIYQEFLTQYNLFYELVGKKPTHLDSHLYAHQVFPKVKKAVVRLANEFKIPVRDVETNFFFTPYFERNFKVCNDEKYNNIITKFKDLIEKNIDKEIIELMVHPGYLDYEILNLSSYTLQRTIETAVLTSKEIKQYVKNISNLELISYAKLEWK